MGGDRVLYLSMIPGNPSHTRKLAGIQRYCAARGWEAEPIPRGDVGAGTMPELLRRLRPVGCVVEGIGSSCSLSPGLFRDMPVSYIGYPQGTTARRPNFRFDTAAIAAAALREFSAMRSPCYAAVGHRLREGWSRFRVQAFRSAVRATGKPCHVFPPSPRNGAESTESFVARLAAWLASLPEHCAVFAVSDETAVLVAGAAHAARRNIPRSLALLSVDNFTELCETVDPPVSSIQLDFERMGFVAARALEETPQSDVIGPLLVVRRKSTGGRGRQEPYIAAAVETIRREACDGLTARALAARFPGSRRLFEMRFREATGHSVLDEILHVRLEKAFTLLSRTATPVGAVPTLCGFRCDRTCDALFRSRAGMSMRDWRLRNALPKTPSRG